MRFVFIALALLVFGLAACDGGGDDSATEVDRDATATASANEPDADGGGTPGPTAGAPSTPGAGGPPPVEGQPTVTDSGLQIIDIEVGTGEAVQAGGTILGHYTGWLEDGTQFATSVGSEPVEFSLTGVIQGWQEGIPGMKVGGKRRLIIPSELAYGETGRPPVIPPNATLTFDVELLEIR